MEKTRAERIRDIRARLPYMSEKSLASLEGFVWAIVRREGYGFSNFEHDRPVLPPEEQQLADLATICMGTIADCLTAARGVTPAYIEGSGEDIPANSLLLGWDRGDVIAVDVRRMMDLWNNAGWHRVKRASLIEWMERCDFILPRHKKPKTIVVDGGRREVVYIFKNKLQPFIDETVRD